MNGDVVTESNGKRNIVTHVGFQEVRKHVMKLDLDVLINKYFSAIKC